MKVATWYLAANSDASSEGLSAVLREAAFREPGLMSWLAAKHRVPFPETQLNYLNEISPLTSFLKEAQYSYLCRSTGFLVGLDVFLQRSL